jgi:hypothetical protein
MELVAGVYDAECALVQELIGGEMVMMLVLNREGERSGFSVSGTMNWHLQLPAMLEDLARSMRDALTVMFDNDKGPA